nr:hypothetical protein [Clostridia bacterium]
DPAQIAGLSVAATYDLSGSLDVNILQKYSDEIASATGRFRAAFNRGSDYIRQAKAEHDLMETYYVPAMDFAAINKKREETLQRILKYAEEIKLG